MHFGRNDTLDADTFAKSVLRGKGGNDEPGIVSMIAVRVTLVRQFCKFYKVCPQVLNAMSSVE